MSINDWSDMFGDSVIVTEMTGRDSYGKPTYGSPATYNCRVVFKDELLRDVDGREVLAKGSVWIQGAPSLTGEDQMQLSDNTTPPIIRTELYQDQSGSHHSKVYFG